MMLRRGIFTVAVRAVVAIAVAAGALHPAPADAQSKVSIGIGGYTFAFLPVLTADAAGLFKNEGLDVTLVQTGGGANTMAAMIGGSVDAAGLVMSDIILAASKGQRVTAFAPLMTQYASDAVVSKAAAVKAGLRTDMPLAERLKRLKGMALAISSRGSGTDKMWRYLLEQGGLDPDRDATLTVVKLDQMYPALRASQIDGFNTSAPTNNRAVQEGLAVWAARPSQGEIPGLENFLYTVLGAKPDFLARNGDITQKLVQALAKASQLIHSDPQRVAALIHESFFKQTDLALLEAAVADQRTAFAEHLTLTQSMYDQNMAFMTKFGEGVNSVKFSDVIEPKFVSALR